MFIVDTRLCDRRRLTTVPGDGGHGRLDADVAPMPVIFHAATQDAPQADALAAARSAGKAL